MGQEWFWEKLRHQTGGRLKLRGEKQSLRINPTTERVVNNTVFLIGTAVDSSSDGIGQGAIVTQLDIMAPVSLSRVCTASTKLLVKVFRYITESFGEMTATQWSIKARPYVKLIRKTPSPRLTLSIKTFLLTVKYALDVQRRISKEVVFHWKIRFRSNWAFRWQRKQYMFSRHLNINKASY